MNVRRDCSATRRPPARRRPASPARGTTPRLLAAHVLGVPRDRLLPLVDACRRPRRGTRAGRAAGRPGAAAAPDRRSPLPPLELAVGPGVFVPRPETELLVDGRWPGWPAGRAVVVDLCAGSGAIALAIAHEHARGAGARRRARRRRALAWTRHNVGTRPRRDPVDAAPRATSPTRRCSPISTAPSTWSPPTRPTCPTARPSSGRSPTTTRRCALGRPGRPGRRPG